MRLDQTVQANTVIFVEKKGQKQLDQIWIIIGIFVKNVW